LSTATLLELAAYRHYALRSDGAIFVEGEEAPGTVLPWLTVGSGRVTLSSGLYDQLLVANTEVNAQTIANWAHTSNPLLGYGELDDVRLRVEVAEDGLSAAWSEIEQTPHKISSAVGVLEEKVSGDIAGVYSNIEQTATDIMQSIVDLDDTLTGQITSVDQKADSISQTVGELEDGVTTKFTEIEQDVDSITQTVGDSESGLVSQVSQLADEITLKVQRRTSDGKLIVTGMGVAIDEEGQSEVAVLADRFRILGDVDGENQPVFGVDTQTGKVYVLGDLIAEGLIRATEVQAEVIKTLLLQAELGFFDELHGLRIRADKLTVGGSASGFVTAKPENAHLWHFDNSLQSTQGLAPASGSATLVPDAGKFGGGVVVQSSLRYDTGAGNKNTVVVYRGTAKLSDYVGMTLAEM